MYFLTACKYSVVEEPVIVTGNAYLKSEITQYNLYSFNIED
jgi:hypothetical protein